jgi:hypothetical protein
LRSKYGHARIHRNQTNYNAVVFAGVGASTSTSTAAIPGTSAPKIGTVSTVITWYFLPVPKPSLLAAPRGGRPRKRGRERGKMVYPWVEVSAGQIGRFIQSVAWREVVLVPTYNGRKGGEGERILVPVPTHVDQLTRRIELSLKMSRS